MKPELFKTLPANLADRTDDELAAVRAEHEDAVVKIKQNDTEFLGELTATDIITQLSQGRENILKIKAEQASRVEAQENFQSEVEKLTADLELSAETEDPGDETDPTDEAEEPTDEVDEIEEPAAEAETEEVEAVVELEAVAAAAAAAAAPARLARPPRPTARHTPKPTQKVGSALVASAGIEGVQPGVPFDDIAALAEALIRVSERSSVSAPGIQEKVVVASARLQYPEERRLERDQPYANTKKINDLLEQVESLVAAGGICAPVTPIYDLPNYAVTDRPVRDAMVEYQAVRGGVTFAAAPSIGDITTGVGIITAAQDAAGGSSGTKTCQTVACPEFSTVLVDAIFACVSGGNLGARAYPEQMAQFLLLLNAAHARLAETHLLDLLKAGSVQVTAAEVGGATSSVFPAMLAIAAQLRSHFRMASDATLRIVAPNWMKDLLKADVVRQPFDKYQISDAELIGIIRSFNLNPSFYLDGETGGGQVFGAQSAGAINGFPSTAKWFVYPEGTWSFLNTGELDLGVVRDSTLNATNQYQIFRETWESAARLGPISYEITSTLADTGALSAPVTISAPTAY